MSPGRLPAVEVGQGGRPVAQLWTGSGWTSWSGMGAEWESAGQRGGKGLLGGAPSISEAAGAGHSRAREPFGISGAEGQEVGLSSIGPT